FLAFDLAQQGERVNAAFGRGRRARDSREQLMPLRRNQQIGAQAAQNEGPPLRAEQSTQQLPLGLFCAGERGGHARRRRRVAYRPFREAPFITAIVSTSAPGF